MRPRPQNLDRRIWALKQGIAEVAARVAPPEPEPDEPPRPLIALLADALAEAFPDDLTPDRALAGLARFADAWAREQEQHPDAVMVEPQTADDWLIAVTRIYDNPFLPPERPTPPNPMPWTPAMVAEFERNMARHYVTPDYDDLADEDELETVYGFTTPLHTPGRGAPPGL